ncbi:multidrug resistance-associated protein 1-like isoform X2 [Sapajus apella]|uniref:Multidrug resistance-associated protein 1-like isoform X2 n=1 Tax=Sapajus apella TaxID=9515 RepID=A0A6J3HF00_SAPAP|nr:multidrug resistance-associated protein 1-like isoform X2 [Sapajus apella]
MENPCSESSASFLSRITFWWITGVVLNLPVLAMWSQTPTLSPKSITLNVVHMSHEQLKSLQRAWSGKAIHWTALALASDLGYIYIFYFLPRHHVQPDRFGFLKY